MIRKVSKDSDTNNSDKEVEANLQPEKKAGRPSSQRGLDYSELPVVAIVGRPNVGKSRLFNRLLGSRKALVQDTPGVTRDRILSKLEWEGSDFILMDTGGMETVTPASGLSERIHAQIKKAVDDADILLFVVDGKVPVHPYDYEVVQTLRKTSKPIVFAVNKIDIYAHRENVHQYYRLGLDPIFSISAEHGIGIDDLLDAVVERLPAGPKRSEEEETEGPVRLTVVGRPNVGKSTWVNTLLGEERQLVDDNPGTTRDAVDTLLDWKGRKYLLIDTAGIRRKGRVKVALEKFSVIKALQSLERSEIAMLMLDATAGVTDQDARVGSYILEKARGVVILLNKWDLIKEKGLSPKAVVQQVRDQFPHLRFAPIVPVSALTGYNVQKAMQTVQRVEKAYRLELATGPLNRFLEDALEAHPPPLRGNRKRRINYITQIKYGPPTFLLFTNLTGTFPVTYQRYLINQLRDRFNFEGAPIRLVFRKKR